MIIRPNRSSADLRGVACEHCCCVKSGTSLYKLSGLSRREPQRWLASGCVLQGEARWLTGWQESRQEAMSLAADSQTTQQCAVQHCSAKLKGSICLLVTQADTAFSLCTVQQLIVAQSLLHALPNQTTIIGV